MNEWSFVTAQPEGEIVSMDGKLPRKEITVQEICKHDGWEIEHASFDQEAPYYWRLILSRPLTTTTRTVAPMGVFIGPAQEVAQW